MAKPRTMGPTIQFRLPLELYELLETRAQAKGLSVNEYTRTRFSESLAPAGTSGPADHKHLWMDGREHQTCKHCPATRPYGKTST